MALLGGSPSYAQGQRELAPPTAQDIPIALMLDLSSNQILLWREADRRFVPASITKVMTAFTAFQLMEDGRIVPNQRMAVSDETFEEWSGKGSSMFVPRGAIIPVDQLLMGITTVSANDGSVVLAEGTLGSVEEWVSRMNAEAHAIGMRDSRFGTPNGWPDAGFTFTTAEDLARLAKAILTRHPAKFRRYFGHRGMEFNGIAQNNHDPISGIAMALTVSRQASPTSRMDFSALRRGRRLVMVVAGPTGAASGSVPRATSSNGGSTPRKSPPAGAGQQRRHGTHTGRRREGCRPPRRGPVHRRSCRQQCRCFLSVVYRGPVPAPVTERRRSRNADRGERAWLPCPARRHPIGGAGWLPRISNAFSGLL